MWEYACNPLEIAAKHNYKNSVQFKVFKESYCMLSKVAKLLHATVHRTEVTLTHLRQV